MARTLAQSDPVLFFQTYKPPIIIDEIQIDIRIFEQIKILCDESEERGLFWLTGSPAVPDDEEYPGHPGGPHWDSGALQPVQGGSGRHGVLQQDDFSLPCLLERQKAAKKNDIVDVFEHIWRGGMPDAPRADPEQRQEYFNSYIETYLMRDVAEEGGITDVVRFRKFLNACAALTAEQVNYRTLAEAAGISQPTAKGVAEHSSRSRHCLPATAPLPTTS